MGIPCGCKLLGNGTQHCRVAVLALTRSETRPMAMPLQLEKYHEQAQLLDPHVPTIVERLTAVIRREALRGSQANHCKRAVQQAAEFLWALVTVRCTSREAILSSCAEMRRAALTCRSAGETGNYETSSRLNKMVFGQEGRIFPDNQNLAGGTRRW